MRSGKESTRAAGKTVLVTGGTGGIGQATATGLAAIAPRSASAATPPGPRAAAADITVASG